MTRSPRPRKLVIDPRATPGLARVHLRTRLLRGCAVIALLIQLPLLLSCARTVRPGYFPRLAEVRRIYVAQFGAGADADQVRDRVRRLLGESRRFIIVDEAPSADAILGGVAGVKLVETTTMTFAEEMGMTATNETHRLGTGQLQLLTAGSSDTIWAFKYRPGVSRQTPVARVAKQAVGQLLADVAAADSLIARRGQSPP